MQAADVLAIGELNPDLVLTRLAAEQPRLGTEQEFGDYLLTLGSSTAITCVLIQRLGLRTAMSAWVGDDDYGRFCRAALEREGVGSELVRTQASLPTGLTIAMPYPSDRLLLTCKGAMALDPSDRVDDLVLRGVRHLHVGSFFLQDALRPRLASLFARARTLGLSTSLDTGWDPAGRWLADDLRAVLANTSYLFPNELEFEHLSGTTDVRQGMTRLLDLGVDTVVLKRGAAGAVNGDAAGLHHVPGFPSAPVDTTGAGDSFNAGYLAALLNGATITERLRWGNACGALTVGAVGGTGGVADAAQVRTFLSARTGHPATAA